jgi:hypothetical protein
MRSTPNSLPSNKNTIPKDCLINTPFFRHNSCFLIWQLLKMKKTPLKEVFVAQQNNKEIQKKWVQILERAWRDPNFKQKLLKNPEQVLKEMGVDLPSDKKIEIHENTDKVVHVIFPSKRGEITEEDLKRVAGGGQWQSPW